MLERVARRLQLGLARYAARTPYAVRLRIDQINLPAGAFGRRVRPARPRGTHSRPGESRAQPPWRRKRTLPLNVSAETREPPEPAVCR